MFYEQIMKEASKYAVYNEDVDMVDLLQERNELLSEMTDMLLEQLNTILINESVWDDFKVKKEDLMDPNKVKSIIRRIDNESIGMDSKAQMLNLIYAFLLALAGLIPGAIVASVGIAMDSAIFANLGILLMYVVEFIVAIGGTDRWGMLISKTKRAIKKVEKKLRKEEDPKYRKVLEGQIKALEKTIKEFQQAEYKAKKNIADKTTYGYSVNYNIN